VLGHEVGDADRPDLAVGQEPFEGLVGAGRAVEGRRQRLVQDEQVELVGAELGGALVEGVQGLVVAVVADPDLGLDEDVRPADAGAADGLADLALVAVGGGGVDVPVAGLQGALDGLGGLLGRGSGRRRGRGRAAARRCSA
jgi:hypothetical protein